MKKIHTNKAPTAIGPYSQAIEHNDILYTSGQIPINPASGKVVEGGIKEQAQQVFNNLKAVIEEAGYKIENTLKVTCFLSDLKNFADFNEIYALNITNKPARSCVQVNRLPLDVLCEVELIVSK